MAQEFDGWDGMESYIERSADRLIERTESNLEYRETPFARYGKARLTDLSYGTGLLMFYAFEHEPTIFEVGSFPRD